MPAWLVSLVFHLVFLTLLGLLKVGDDDDGPYITLSATVSKDVRSGGDEVVVDPTNELAFDLPVPKEIDLNDTTQREAFVRADQEARELRLDPDADDPHLPDLDRIKQTIRQSSGIPRSLAVRDPRIRVEVVKREGGTTLTEAAVARGLRWLAKHQAANGSWSLDRYNRSSGCTCSGTGLHSDPAGTSLALLPFLGAGQTHLVGRYQNEVSRALRWLINQQKPSGDLRGDSRGNTGMYAHGQAAIVLCEAFLMTGDEALRAPAQKSIDFIVEAQHPGGGWRYSPGEAGDTSVVGWQLMALQSARAANLTVPDETLELASHYLDSVQYQGGSRYAYRPGNRPTEVMTAEALLCRIYLGWTQQTPGLNEGVQYLIDDALPDKGHTNFYYWYYGTQTLHHYGGQAWDRWNRRIREILVEKQKRRGHAAGSWDPEGPHANGGGRIYVTSLAICTLEVYYRHLPIFHQIELE
jgi:hypothetical protein